MHNNLAGVEGLTDGHAWHLSTAEKTVVGNTSGTNTGDQVADGTTILGAGSIADPFRVANVTGPQGPQGFQGDVGPQGFQGDVGPQGFQGDVGPQGFQGNTGAASTVAGPQGSTGPQGFQGPAGDPANSVVNQNGGNPLKLWSGSQAEYNAIDPKDADTLYFIS